MVPHSACPHWLMRIWASPFSVRQVPVGPAALAAVTVKAVRTIASAAVKRIDGIKKAPGGLHAGIDGCYEAYNLHGIMTMRRPVRPEGPAPW